MENIPKNYDNSNYYASLMIFQTYKNAVLKNVHTLGWLFWLCFYPLTTLFNAIFDLEVIIFIDIKKKFNGTLLDNDVWKLVL